MRTARTPRTARPAQRPVPYRRPYRGSDPYPNAVHITPWMSWSASNTTPLPQANTSAVSLGRLVTTANSEYVEWNVRLAAGTWTVKIIYVTSTSYGVFDAKLDGSTFATVDTYAGSTVQNVVSTTTGVAVASSGIHALRLLTNGKNASSSGYNVVTVQISLVRTGA